MNDATTPPDPNADVPGSVPPGGSDSLAGKVTGTESSLSNWAGPYVTDMLGRGQALANQPYTAYTGPLTAGQSTLQSQAFSGLAGLAMPTMDSYTPQTFSATAAQQYMNPYLQSALAPQIAEARRQSDIQRMLDAARLTKAGAYGGSRQAIMESENRRNLMTNLANITGQGYMTAYDKAQQQFNTEQERARAMQDANRQYGLGVLGKQAELGGIQRGITAEGITADRTQFEEERDFPYKNVQYMQSLLQGLPLAAQSYNYAQPSVLSEILGTGGLGALYGDAAGGSNKVDMTSAAKQALNQELADLAASGIGFTVDKVTDYVSDWYNRNYGKKASTGG